MCYYRPTREEINAVKRQNPKYDDWTAYRVARDFALGRLNDQRAYYRKLQRNIAALATELDNA